MRSDRISETQLNNYVEQTGIDRTTKNDRSSFLTTITPPDQSSGEATLSTKEAHTTSE